MTTLQVLKRARALIRKGWTQGAMRRFNRKGEPVAWCSYGALCDSLPELGVSSHEALARVAGAAYASIERAMGGKNSMVAWNDHPGRTKAQVLRAFDKAIKAQAK